MLKLKCCDFDLKQTLECGQIFRFNRISDNEYIIFTQSNIAHLIQQNDKDSKILLIDSNNNDENFWIEYFDLNTDYNKLNNASIFIVSILEKNKCFKMKNIFLFLNSTNFLH